MSDDKTSAAAHPRGYDVAQYQRDVLAHVGKIVKDIELRKWAVEKSIAAAEAGDATSADAIYGFITAGMREPIDGTQ